MARRHPHGFQLGKRWQQTVEPQNVVVKVTPSPVGAAAKISDRRRRRRWRVRTSFFNRCRSSWFLNPRAPAPARADCRVHRPADGGRRTAINRHEGGNRPAAWPSRRLIAIERLQARRGTARCRIREPRGLPTAKMGLLEGIAVEDVRAWDQTQVLSVLPGSTRIRIRCPASSTSSRSPYHLTWDTGASGTASACCRPGRHCPTSPARSVTATQLNEGTG